MSLQSDQMTRIFSTFGHLYQWKLAQWRTKFAKVGPIYCQIVNKPSKNCPRLWRFNQNGEISPNLVTLYLCVWSILPETVPPSKPPKRRKRSCRRDTCTTGKRRSGKLIENYCLMRWTRIARKIRLHIKQIILKNVFYFQVQNIHTYPLCKTIRGT